MKKYKNPYLDFELQLSQPKSKFTSEEDQFLLCAAYDVGYGNWEQLKAKLLSALPFRFDWFIKSRTAVELGKRVDTLIKLLEKEKEKEETKKVIL